MSPLSQKILTTLAYYDVMDYPMTAFEVWKYLISNKGQVTSDKGENAETSLAEVIRELENEELKKHIDHYRGYYFLKGRQGLVSQRIERNKIAERKFKTTRRIAWWLRFVPFVRMAAVTGTLAMKNTQRKSDLDLLIVLKHGHIFTGRTLVTFLVHILGKRRYGSKIANRICLNYFITDQSLEINLQDLFSSSEYSFIIPVFDLGVFNKFQESNQWIKNYRENYHLEEVKNLKTVSDSKISRTVREIGEIIFSFRFIEENLKKWETERIMKDPRTHLPGSMVMASDDALIFLPEPQGPGVFEKFQERLKAFSKS